MNVRIRVILLLVPEGRVDLYSSLCDEGWMEVPRTVHCGGDNSRNKRPESILEGLLCDELCPLLLGLLLHLGWERKREAHSWTLYEADVVEMFQY